ncbi:MAG: hypothetical protein OEZ16_06125 [Chromatiales bacterium]|nr:hypothetical protein [Chromatiales bacterium]
MKVLTISLLLTTAALSGCHTTAIRTSLSFETPLLIGGHHHRHSKTVTVHPHNHGHHRVHR